MVNPTPKLAATLALLASMSGAAEWTIDDTVSDLVIYGIGVADAQHAMAGTISSGGAEPAFYNGTGWTFTHDCPSGAIMDVAVLPNNEVALYATFSGPYLSTDEGKSWAHVSDVIDPVQSVQALNSDTFALAGEFTSKELGYFGGVVMSTDKGSTWTDYDIEDAHFVRYGDYPSTTTWFITEGDWPANDLPSPFVHISPNLATGFELSSRIRIGKVNLQARKAKQARKGTDLGYVANIYKTTDGGSTFSKVFSSGAADNFYFNSISCGSEITCVAVAEGKKEDPSSRKVEYTTFAYQTADGGKTWTKVFDGGDAYMSLMAVKMISENEGWMGPTGFLPGSSTTAITDFFYTSDGGVTWTLEQTLEDCISSEIDAADGLIMSTCIGYGPNQEARVAIYK